LLQNFSIGTQCRRNRIGAISTLLRCLLDYTRRSVKPKKMMCDRANNAGFDLSGGGCVRLTGNSASANKLTALTRPVNAKSSPQCQE
jgi:hypothetical protein